MERIVCIMLLISTIFFSCKRDSKGLNENNSEEKVKEKLDFKEASVKTADSANFNKVERIVPDFDTIFFELDDIKKEYIGVKKFPMDSLNHDQIVDSIKNNNVIYILDSSSLIIVIKDNPLFNSYIDSFKQNYLGDKYFLESNGYKLENLEEPIGATLIKKDKDSVVVFNNNHHISIESIYIESGNKLASVFLKDYYNFKSFLLNHDINLPFNLTNGEIILVSNQIVNGTWFKNYRKKGYFEKNRSFENGLLNQYQFSIKNDTIRSFKFGEFIGF